MKNNNPSTKYAAKDLFNTIGGGMHNGPKHRNADNYASMKTRVESQIDRYDEAVATNPITLETIQPLWATKCTERTTAHNMYESRPDLIQDIRNDLMQINGGGGKYKCPLCEVNDVYHLDHYIPREKMSEFSVHPSNLIYICRDCNEIKDTMWLDGAGKRIVFNAYYDRISGKELLLCLVDTIVDGMPRAVIVETPSIEHNDDSLRELSTLKSLGIDKMYERKVNDMLQSQCGLAIEQVRLAMGNGQSIDEAWGELRQSYLNVLARPLEVISRLTFKGMANSSVMRDWLESEVGNQR